MVTPTVYLFTPFPVADAATFNRKVQAAVDAGGTVVGVTITDIGFGNLTPHVEVVITGGDFGAINAAIRAAAGY